MNSHSPPVGTVPWAPAGKGARIGAGSLLRVCEREGGETERDRQTESRDRLY